MAVRISNTYLAADVNNDWPPAKTNTSLKSLFQKALIAFPVLNPRNRSLTRSNLLVFGSICFVWPAFRNPVGLCASLLPLAVLVSIIGMLDTARNMRKRWDFYHAGVLLMLYADLMAISLLVFMAVYSLLPAMSK